MNQSKKGLKMTANNTYNGWTNYATWRINLEMFDSWGLGDIWGFEDTDPKEVDTHELGQILQEYAETRMNEDAASESLALSYAMAFLSDVNWSEIAQRIIDEELQNA
jgi:hypothetical protein